MFTTKREIQHSARVFAQEQGITEGFGSRGRVAKPVILAFLVGSKPATVRAVAEVVGIEVSPKGKPSAKVLDTLATAVASNAPKAEAGE
jgi:hypothetical protein